MDRTSQKDTSDPAGADGEEARGLHQQGGSDGTRSESRSVAARESTRVERVVEQTRDIASDLVDLLELKIQLTQAQIEEKVEREVNGFISRTLVGAGIAVTLLFGLVAASIALGDWFDSQALGFLATTLFLAIVTLIFWRSRVRYYSIGSEKRQMPRAQSSETGKPETKQIPPHPSE